MKTERDGKLRIALERLLWRYPLLGGLAASWDCRPVGTDTMAVGMDDQTFVLYYSPGFVAETNIDQLVGVLHHEARHVIYGHVMMDPDEFTDYEALLIAQEVTVNEGLPEPLPEGAVRLRDFPELPPDEDTVTRYDRLRQESGMSLQSESKQAQQSNQEQEPDRTSQDEADSQQGEGGEKSDGESGDAPQEHDCGTPQNKCGDKPVDESAKTSQDDGDGAAQGNSGEIAKGESDKTSQEKDDSQRGVEKPADESVMPSQGEGSETAKGESDKPPEVQGGMPISSEDREADHGHWQEIRDQGSHAKNLIDIAMQEFLAAAKQEPSTAGADMATLDRACQAWEITPGNELTQLPRIPGKPDVDWRRVLRSRVGRLSMKRPTYSRPPRRFPNMIGIVPGTAQSATKPKIMAVIDTSASMTDEMLGAINLELEFLSRDHQVVIVECDCTIQAVYPYRPLVCVTGRGGTDFRPPLERAFLREHAVDLVIFFTDGLGPAPEHGPYIPVIWTLTSNGIPPVPWGEVLRMA
jgi:predicted metal-dependent peptidase